ncbi:PH and SEC7 domain-containing protein 3-like [Sinocyclocheilus grahami]|uniref:PH and SEC7 domain-containing protein 3-like n=1 Tax=Sinocyclocheilus grahami TaxID=75366 RepID=UPI0007AD2402|nr:PREDICTED: PH and SEC7 domain-containing protein 3-like [Sinocyclocheilus grahami]
MEIILSGEAFDWVSSSSAHAQSVAKAKYQFLFGKTEDTSSADSVAPPTQEKQGSGSGLESALDDDDIDETSLFQEIDRELSNLLSGLTARSQHAASGQDSMSGNATAASPMIPCNGQDETPLSQLDMAKQGLDVQNGQSELAGDSLLFDSWCEALIKDPSSVMAAANELSCFSSGPSRDPRNALACQNKPDASPTPAAAHGEQPSEVPSQENAGKEMEGKRAGSPLPSRTDDDPSAELVDGSLEESNKILAEIPGIFSGFLEGGKLRDKPPKKLRFVESRESLVNGEMQNGTYQSCSVKEEVTLDAQHTEATGVPQGRVLRPDHNPAENGSDRCSAGESDATDVFSCQFEIILESERLRGTLYSSMDSLSNPAPEPSSHSAPGASFAFDIPLTPMIQQRLKDRSLFLSSDAEVLSVAATKESVRAALEVTSSFLSAGREDAGNGLNDKDPRDWLQGCFRWSP